jgi:hypothetical protein
MIAMSPVTDWGIANPGRTDLRRDWLATSLFSALHLHGRSLLLGKSEIVPLGLHVRLERFCTNTALIIAMEEILPYAKQALVPAHCEARR